MHPQYTPQDIARFWRKVEKADGCWQWTAAIRGSNGYGAFWLNGRHVGAHRVAWELAYGPIPQGLLACHHCDNPRCVNPLHLFLGTHDDNMADRSKKGRQAIGDQVPPDRRPRGERHGSRTHPERLVRGEEQHNAKLTAEQVRSIRARRDAGVPLAVLAAEFGVTKALISMIGLRQIWKHVE